MLQKRLYLLHVLLEHSISPYSQSTSNVLLSGTIIGNLNGEFNDPKYETVTTGSPALSAITGIVGSLSGLRNDSVRLLSFLDPRSVKVCLNTDVYHNIQDLNVTINYGVNANREVGNTDCYI